jgi:hypothetical protein
MATQMKIVETVYQPLAAWPDDVQEAILGRYRDYNTQDEDWFEFVKENFIEACAALGIEVTAAYFSGFSSQGDGASFTGHYTYKKGALAQVKKDYPTWSALHEAARELQEVQKYHKYQLEADIGKCGRHVHEQTMNVTLSSGCRYDNIRDDAEPIVLEVMQCLAREYYENLEDEYEYRTGDEALKETFDANGCLFSEDGEIEFA